MRKHYLRKEQALFLIIDLQEKLMRVMAHAAEVEQNTKVMLAVCRQLALPVVVTEQYPRGLGRTVPEVAGRLGEHRLLEKITFSAVTGEMEEKLQALQRRQVLVAGCETHVCVFQTVRDLLAAGFEVYVLQDAVCSRRRGNHKNGLQLMREEGALITDTETALFDLFKVAGTPEFKAVQPLLK